MNQASLEKGILSLASLPFLLSNSQPSKVCFLNKHLPHQASLEKGIVSLASLGKETVRGLMVHAMVEVMMVMNHNLQARS